MINDDLRRPAVAELLEQFSRFLDGGTMFEVGANEYQAASILQWKPSVEK